MGFVSFNPTASATDSAKIAYPANTSPPPNVAAKRNFVFVLPMIWVTPTLAGRGQIFTIQSSETASGNAARSSFQVDYDVTNTQLRVISHLTGSANFAFATITDAMDGITEPTPALLVVRGTVSGSNTQFEVHAEVYGGTPETETVQIAGAPAAVCASGEWGFGNIATFDGSNTSILFEQPAAIRDVVLGPAIFRFYADAASVPSVANVVAALKAAPSAIFYGSVWGSPTSVEGIGFPFSGGNNGGGTGLTFTQYGIGTQITSVVNNVLCVSLDQPSGTDFVKTTRVSANVAGTHTIVNPFTLAPEDYLREVVVDPLSGSPPDRGQGYAGRWEAWSRDALPEPINIIVDAQSWGVGQGTSPTNEVETGSGCGCGFAQGLTLYLRDTCVGQLLEAPIGVEDTTARQQRYRLGFTTDFGGAGGVDPPTFTNAGTGGNIGANYEDFVAFGINGTALSSGGASSLGGYPLASSFNLSLAAEWSMAVDFRDFAMVEDDTPVEFVAHFLAYGGAATEVSIQGETREVDTAHGTEAQAQAVITGDVSSLDTGEGVEREIATIAAISSNVSVVTFEGEPDDLDPVSIAYGVANPHASDARGWVAKIRHSTLEWIKPISAASYDVETGVWTVSLRPGFHSVPANTGGVPDETTTIRCSAWEIRSLRVSGVQDGDHPIRAIRCKRPADAGGRAYMIAFDWKIDAIGERVGGLGSGSSNYGQWDVYNAPCLFWHLKRACGMNAAIMMNTAVSADGVFTTQINRLRSIAPDGVIAMYIPRICTSNVDLSPSTDSNRLRLRNECAASGVPYLDMAVVGGGVGDALFEWHFQDQTHFSGAGYEKQAGLLLEEIGDLAIASGGGGGRLPVGWIPPLVLINPDDVEDD